MAKSRSMWQQVAVGILAAKLATWALNVARRLMFRWRRILTPLWFATAVWFTAVLWHWLAPHWWGLALALPPIGISLAVFGPQLTDRTQRLVSLLVPDGLDRGRPDVLDRPAERIYFATLVSAVGVYLALRVAGGPSHLTATLWQLGLLGLGGTWWWHRRVRTVGRADKFSRQLTTLMRNPPANPEFKPMVGGRVIRATSLGRSGAKIRIRLVGGFTVQHVARIAGPIAGYLRLRSGAVYVSELASDASSVELTILPRDPWNSQLPHPAGDERDLTLDGVDWRLPLGVYSDGRELTWRIQHVLVVGQTGSGKSVWIQSLLRWAITFRDVAIVGADLASGATLGAWEPAMAVPVARTPEETVRLLEGLLLELEAREALLAEAGDDDSLIPSPDMPLLLVVIDEYPDLVAATEEAVTLMDRLAKRARKVLIRLVIGAQNGSKADLGSKEAQGQFSTVVGMRLDPHPSKVLWGSLAAQGWTSVGLETGQFQLRDQDHTLPAIAKGYWTDKRDRRTSVERASSTKPVLSAATMKRLGGPSSIGSAGMVVEGSVVPRDAVLAAVLDGGRTWQEINAVTGLSKATIYRRLNGLIEAGLVKRDGASYVPGEPARMG